MKTIQANPFILPSFVAFLVILVAALTIALMAVNTDKAVSNVVDSLQEQALSVAETRFDQLLLSLLTDNENLAKEIGRINVPPPANNQTELLTLDGQLQVVAAMDRVVNNNPAIDLSYYFFPNGRAVFALPESSTRNYSRYGEEDYSLGTRIYAHPTYNVTPLKNLDYSTNITTWDYHGEDRPFYRLTSRTEPFDYAWIGPYYYGDSGYMTVVHSVMNADGTYLCALAADVILSNFQTFFKSFRPTEQSVLFVVDTRAQLIVTSRGPITTVTNDRIKVFDSNETVIAAAGRSVADWSAVSGTVRGEFKVDGKKWLLTAKPFNAYRNNFVTAIATPHDEFAGEVNRATRDTIIICVVITLVVFAIIVGMMIQQHRMVEGSKQSVIVAQDVAGHLIMYNTDAAAITLDNATKPIFVDESTGTESPNYVSKDLVKTLKKINDNLILYKAHLPEFLINDSNDGSLELGDLDMMEEESDVGGSNSKHRSADQTKDSSRNSTSRHAKRKSLNGGMKKSTDAGDFGNETNNPYFVKVPTNEASTADNRTSKSHNSASTAGGEHRNQVAKVALLRNSGDYVERVVLANLNLSRIPEVLFPIAKGNKVVSIRHINKVIEIILDTASKNDATVHSLVGDSLQVSVNAVSRCAHADVKACRFITAADIALKKEITDVIAKEAQTTTPGSAVPVFNTHRALLTGSLCQGAAWAQLGGSDRRQAFMLVNFSESDNLKYSFELGVRRGLIVVDRTMNQNIQHEFVTRGCGVHAFPGAHQALFGAHNESVYTASANSTDGDAPSSSSSNAGAANTNTGPRADGKTLLAVPLYELVSRKKLNNADEWLYVVGDGKEQNKTLITQIANELNDVAMSVCRGNAAVARAGLQKIQELDADAAFLGAYKNLDELTNKLVSS